MTRFAVFQSDHPCAATTTLWLRRLGFITLLIIAGYCIYYIFIKEIIDRHNLLVGFLGIWVVLAYVALPRINRMITKLYIPDYYIGRVRTGDGLLGDPINLALNGSEASLIAAMEKAGWTRADPVTLKSSLRIIWAVLARKKYPAAPVSPLFLFGVMQNFAFQQDVKNSPDKRHHIRFWKTPLGWILPGGYKVDWLASGTYDRKVGLSAYTLQVTHRIAANTDQERDHVVSSLKTSGGVGKLTVIEHYSTGYHSRNGGGDSIQTDGALPIVDLKNQRLK